jgi:hypothetical protein
MGVLGSSGKRKRTVRNGATPPYAGLFKIWRRIDGEIKNSFDSEILSMTPPKVSRHVLLKPTGTFITVYPYSELRVHAFALIRFGFGTLRDVKREKVDISPL